MTVKNRYCVVLSTCGDKDEAEGLAHLLVEKRIAACVQISGVIGGAPASPAL